MSTLIERMVASAKLLRASSEAIVGDARHWMKDCATDCEQAAQELQRRQWRNIETAPKVGDFLAAIWHGGKYRVVKARRVGPFISDTEMDSCVAWKPGFDKPSPMWQPLPAPPTSTPPVGGSGSRDE